MEIESMNIMESTNNSDSIRARIQKHKQDFSEVRKEMRQIQQKNEKSHFSNLPDTDFEV